MSHMRYFAVFVLVFSFLFSVAQPTDAKGMKQGYVKKKDADGKLLYEGSFKDDKPVGKFKYYYPNDSVRAIMVFRNGGSIANAQLFHMNGKKMATGKYVNKEIKDSVWTYYDEAGVLISRDSYKMGKKDGICYVYLPDGNPSEIRRFKQDAMHGEFKEYFDATHVRAQGNYVNGGLEGRVVYYYPNGVEVAAGYYKNGLKNGPWIYKTESNKVREKELYKNGVLASQKETEAFFNKEKTDNTTKPQGTTGGKSNTPNGQKPSGNKTNSR